MLKIIVFILEKIISKTLSGHNKVKIKFMNKILNKHKSKLIELSVMIT